MRPEILFPLFAPVTRLKGVGPAVAKALERVLPERVGGPLVRDLVFHLPTGVVDRRATFPLHEARSGITATFVVTVNEHAPPPRGQRKRPYRVYCSNATGDLVVVFFNASEDYIKQALPVGQSRVISGMTELYNGHVQITHPDIIAPPSQLASVQVIEPVYPLTAGMTNRRLAAFIRMAMDTAPALPEWIDAATLAAEHFPAWRAALQAAHAPAGEEDLAVRAPARARLAYDEILAHQLHLGMLRGKMHQRPGRVIAPEGTLRAALLEHLPFALTAGQRAVLAEIDADLARGERMTRLLQGDVGSGKTIVALAAALHAIECGAQVAFMAPTELVAAQHAETIRALTAHLPVKSALLSGRVKGRAREDVLAGIQQGEVQLVVGTHALFQEQVQFADLALLIIDEQHRFGVAQRMALAAKGEHPHLLHMTATPIPRSLTLMAYGDMDCSLLTEKPAGRQPIVTRVVPAARTEEVLEGVQRALDKGEKLYWICPQIEENERAAESRFTEFSARFGAEAVALVHGRMKPDVREAEMQRFATGSARLLVATTVVEVGVDVRDATIMVIEQAERFGLSQIHQLRGRVGRGSQPSACVLLYSDNAGEEARARLSILRESDDGFRIAEEDLKIRGGGDVLGTRQSGLPVFRFIDLVAHQPLIQRARDQVRATLAESKGVLSAPLQTLLALHDIELHA